MTKKLLALVLLVPTLGLNAQEAGEPLTFEVASIKVRTVPGGSGPPSAPDRYSRSNVSFRNLVQDAFGLSPFQVVGGPIGLSLSGSMSARTPSIVSRSMRLICTCIDRFGLRTHRNTRTADPRAACRSQ